MKMKTRTNQPVEGDELDNLKLSGDLELEGDMSIDEDSKVAIFENIVDKDGHNRFIECDIELLSNLPSGTEKLYGKWSLSGSHLMIVVAFSLVNGAVMTAGTSSSFIADIVIPEWIYNKIVPLYSNIIAPYTVFKAFGSGGVTQNIEIRCIKQSENTLRIDSYNFTASDDRTIRVQFDLLIDNE